MVIVFLTALLAPILGGKAGNAEATMARLGWAFYCFAGGIIWFLRPCLARAKYVRFEIEQIQARTALAAGPVASWTWVKGRAPSLWLRLVVGIGEALRHDPDRRRNRMVCPTHTPLDALRTRGYPQSPPN